DLTAKDVTFKGTSARSCKKIECYVGPDISGAIVAPSAGTYAQLEPVRTVAFRCCAKAGWCRSILPRAARIARVVRTRARSPSADVGLDLDPRARDATRSTASTDLPGRVSNNARICNPRLSRR